MNEKEKQYFEIRHETVKIIRKLAFRAGEKLNELELENSEYMEPEYQKSDYLTGLEYIKQEIESLIQENKYESKNDVGDNSVSLSNN